MTTAAARPRQTLRHLWALIQSDQYRYAGRLGPREFCRLWVQEKGFAATVIYRLNRYCWLNRYRGPFVLCQLLKHLYQALLQYELPKEVQAGPGLKITHVIGLVVHTHCVLGKNVNLSHQVTLGSKPAGAMSGSPAVGNQVYIAPGAKIIGGIHIADGTAVGANAVVTKSFPEQSVLVGVPARALSQGGSGDYCTHMDYEDQIRDLPSAEAW